MSRNKFWVKVDGRKQDDIKSRSAKQKAVLYYLVALYIGYMGYSVISNRLAGDDTMSYPLAIILTSILIIGAVWVAWYATKRMKNDTEQSEIEASDKKEDQD